jgi:hypothetical protein
LVRFAAHFGINLGQAELDFVNIDTDTDIRVYVDPYAIEIRDDEWSNSCTDHIRSFFSEVLAALTADDLNRVSYLLNNLHEPNETCFGQSIGRPSGRAIGWDKAEMLARALRNSKAFQTGLLADISEAELFIPGFGPDTISDLTTNVLRGPLASYTKEQCDLYDIPTEPRADIGPVWSLQNRDWEAKYLELPVVDGRTILLVPKYSVRRRLSLDSREFWDFHMIHYLRQEHLDSNSSLVHVLKKTKERVVYKREVKEQNPYDKNGIAEFVQDHPDILDAYKALKRGDGPMESDDFDNNFDERTFARVLIQRLAAVPGGNDAATEYHRMCIGILSFLFYPQLITPVREQEIHQGRKRIDIKFTTSAQPGFFLARLQSAQTRANNVMVECKNYTREVANPEYDQMTGRFGHQRGFFGILLCRSLENRQRAIAASRDAANDGRGYMLVFEDADLIEMLELIEAGRRNHIDRFLQARFDEITH